jgi:hypothetical protein
MSDIKKIQSPALRGQLAVIIAGITTGIIGSIFFREFWLAIAGAATKQVEAMPFWLSIVIGGFLFGMFGLGIARGIKKHVLLLTLIGVAIGVILTWTNAIVLLLTAFLSSLSGEGGGLLLVVIAMAFMFITNVMIIIPLGKILGILIGAIFKFKKILIVCGIVSAILLIAMWRISVSFSLGIVDEGINGALLGFFVGIIVTNRAATNIYNNNREGGTVDKLFGEEEKPKTSENVEMETIVISAIAFIGGIVGAILGGLGILSF